MAASAWAMAAAAAAEIDFSHEVAPILRKHCVACHGGEEVKGGFSINTRELFVDDDMATPGKADQSPFLTLVRSSDPEEQMPPKEKGRLSRAEIETLRRWVDAGMPWDAGFSFSRQVYEPPLKPRRPKLPPVVDGRSNPLDRILDAQLAEQGTSRPARIDDGRFLRRVSLDLIGLPPTPEALDAFLADKDPGKRARTIRRLLDDEIDYADHWLTFWNDLLRNDYAGVGFDTGRRMQISGWLYETLRKNKPFDRMVSELIAPPTSASRGFGVGITWRGNASAGQSTEIQFAQSVAQSFLGINLKCASCHDSFIDRWKLEEAYGLAAIYSKRPLEIYRCDKPVGRVAKASWLFPELGQVDPEADKAERLRQLAGLMTHPENGRTARTIVNRLWARLMGRGIVHPLDAMQTEPWNADLLDFLAVHLVDRKYDLKAVLELIANSEAYQSKSEVVAGDPAVGDYVYRGPRSRRLTAEQFVDAVWKITSSAPTISDAPIDRWRSEEGDRGSLKIQGRWIWGASAERGRMSPAGETIMLRRIFRLRDVVESGVGVISCDNRFTLYVNGHEVARGDDWGKPVSVAFHNWLEEGLNQIVVRAKNVGESSDEAGLFFEARLTLKNGGAMLIASGPDWQWNPNAPELREGGLGDVEGRWRPATVVEPLGAWTRTVTPEVVSGRIPMVRASLMKSDFLMRSLGRPSRERIVSSRPANLSVLTAVDLYNNEILARSLWQGGRQLASRDWSGTDELAEYLYRFALSRSPTVDECESIREAIGETPESEGVEDLLWAIFLKPEFMVVR